MTVEELIDVLESHNPTAEVVLSGGDYRYHIDYHNISEMLLDSNLEPIEESYDDNDDEKTFVVLGEEY